MEIAYRATDRVRALIGSLGRTEDVRFSPNNRRLAIAAFNRSRIAVLDVEIAGAAGRLDVSLKAGVDISSSSLSYPHGLDFLDDDTLVVANRKSDVAIFKLPAAEDQACELSPLQILAAGNGSLLNTPGSVAVVRREDAPCELLICNNYGDSVTRHVVGRNGAWSIESGEVLLSKWINLPDGVCVSNDCRWVAISNHNTHGVLLYERSPSLRDASNPDGVLRGTYFPHGLRFSPDGRYIFVADAGAPFVHVYAHEGAGWRGARSPAASVRIMDEPLFLRGRQNPQEGGPKGIDIDRDMKVLVATSEHQPLLFLDLTAMLAKVPAPSQALEVEYEIGLLQMAERLRVRVRGAEARAAKAEVTAAKAEARAAEAESRAITSEAKATHEAERVLKFKAKAKKAKAKVARAKARTGFAINGRPWRVTAPFSLLYSILKRS